MATNRKLIDYLPPYMQEYLEMQKIMDAQQYKVDLLWTAAETALADQFIQDATAYGVARWESMLDISPKDTDTLDERKFRILTRLNQELPYTLRRLEQVLTALCGSDGYSIRLIPNEYYIEVRLALENENKYVEVENVMRKMIPANMTQYVQIMYNTHGMLAPFTHEFLSAYTHDQLRKEEFE